MSILKELVYRLRGEFTTEKLIKMGLTVGKNFKRLHGVILDPSHCWLITIGDDVTIAPRVHILAHDASTKNYIDYTRIGRVTIGNNVFIGAESVILPNVTIGDDVIIGANSTVTKDIPSGVVVAGSPAKIITTTDAYIMKIKDEASRSPKYDESYTLRGDITKEKKAKMKRDLSDAIGFVD